MSIEEHKKMLSFKVTIDFLEEIRDYVSKREIDLSKFIREAIREKLEKEIKK